MVRSYARLKTITTDAGNTISLHAARDAADDFFQHCYHLKDWLKKDSRTSQLDVEGLINSSQALSLAADYCNSFKHGGLNKNSRSGKAIQETNVHTTLDLTPKGFVATSRLEIIIDGKSYDAFKLAADCMKEWDDFLASNSIKLL